MWKPWTSVSTDTKEGLHGFQQSLEARMPDDWPSDCTAFQQLETDYFIGRPDLELVATELAEVPILRMYGVTEQGGLLCQAC